MKVSIFKYSKQQCKIITAQDKLAQNSKNILINLF